MVEKTCMREHLEATAGVKVRADDGLNWVRRGDGGKWRDSRYGFGVEATDWV